MLLSRRGLISGLLAMPAVVQADRLMRISAPKVEIFLPRTKTPDPWETGFFLRTAEGWQKVENFTRVTIDPRQIKDRNILLPVDELYSAL